jgi:hypothetical protein
MDLHFPLSALLFLAGMMLAQQAWPDHRPLLLAASMAAIAVAATVTMTGGLVCWPLFVLIHAVRTQRLAGSAMIAIIGVVTVWFYLRDLPLALGADDTRAVLLRLPSWLIRYMGAAWVFGPIRLDLLGGAVALLGGFVAVWRLVMRKVAPADPQTQGLYLLLFGLANGVLTGAGRQGLIGSRYALFGELAQLGLVLMFLPQIRAAIARLGGHRVTKATVLILVLASAGTTIHDIRRVAADREHYAHLHSALLHHVDPDLLAQIHPFSAETAARGIAGLAHFHAYGFVGPTP